MIEGQQIWMLPARQVVSGELKLEAEVGKLGVAECGQCWLDAASPATRHRGEAAAKRPRDILWPVNGAIRQIRRQDCPKHPNTLWVVGWGVDTHPHLGGFGGGGRTPPRVALATGAGGDAGPTPAEVGGGDRVHHREGRRGRGRHEAVHAVCPARCTAIG